jgi:hypothetical protein
VLHRPATAEIEGGKNGAIGNASALPYAGQIIDR